MIPDYVSGYNDGRKEERERIVKAIKRCMGDHRELTDDDYPANVRIGIILGLKDALIICKEEDE